jgi:hypothetical protein
MFAVTKTYGRAGVVTLLTLLPPIGTPATAGTDLLMANIDTKYGSLTIENVRIVSRGESCELRANVSNLAPVAWSALAVEILVDGRDDKGDAVKVTGKAEADRLSRDATGFVTGRCTHRAIGDFGNGLNPQKFEALRVRAKFLSGTPNPTDAAAYGVAQKQRAASQKRAAEASSARAAALAKFPILNSGTPSAFIGSDRKCAAQFQEALGMEGLEKRKRIADLVSYGCGFLAENPVRVSPGQRDGAFVFVTMMDGKQLSKNGWVPTTWLK